MIDTNQTQQVIYILNPQEFRKFVSNVESKNNNNRNRISSVIILIIALYILFQIILYIFHILYWIFSPSLETKIDKILLSQDKNIKVFWKNFKKNLLLYDEEIRSQKICWISKIKIYIVGCYSFNLNSSTYNQMLDSYNILLKNISEQQNFKVDLYNLVVKYYNTKYRFIISIIDKSI